MVDQNTAHPIRGAKPCFLITDDLDNSELLCQLVQVTANALPIPKPKAAQVAKPEKVAAPAKQLMGKSAAKKKKL